MKKNLVAGITVLSVLSLALMAFSPASTVSAAYEAYRGPNNDPAERPLGDADCDLDGAAQQSRGANAVGRAENGTVTGRIGNGNGAGYALVPLSDAETAGLVRAIEEEYTALALYQSVMDTFGEVAPFAEIAASEQVHVNALIRQAEKYGISVPAYDSSIYNFPTFSTLDEAYQAGIDAEIVDAALYDELMADVTHSDLIRVYTNLQNASLNHHLVSFQSYLND
jgi:hypothetical protein